jgi:hypothetical protein
VSSGLINRFNFSHYKFIDRIMIMSQLQHGVVVLWILSFAFCSGLYQPANIIAKRPSMSPLYLPNYHPQRVLFGKTERTRQSTFISRSSCLMTPFWKSSSSDNEKNNKNEDDNNNNNNNKEGEDVTDPTFEETSTVSNVSEVNRSVVSPEPAVTTASSSSSSSSSSTSKKEREGILDLINDIGQNFKPLAEKATARGYQANTQTKKILYAVQACTCYMLFILYRAYRGLFVLVPAVFRQVYRKMELAMNSDLTLQDDDDDDNKEEENVFVVGDVVTTEITTTHEKVSWRTKLTVSVLASVVTMSYVLGAAVKMMTKFVRTVSKSRSIPKSFEAAADELLTYEDRVSRIGKINGDTNMEPGGFAP